MMQKMNDYPLILAMLQPKPLPGSYLHEGMPIQSITDALLKEAEILAKIGYDGFILQNMHDGPIKQTANIETVAYMTYLAKSIKDKFQDKVLGILVNWDGVAGLSIADAVQADFVRIEYLYTGACVGISGIIEGQCVDILNLKKRLGSSVKIYADAQEINGNFIVPKPKDKEAVRIVKRAFADGIFISGETEEESIELVEKIRPHVSGAPIFLGGGATGENIYNLLQYYDGVSVATWIKNGDMQNEIDLNKARQFYEAAYKAKIERQKMK